MREWDACPWIGYIVCPLPQGFCQEALYSNVLFFELGNLQGSKMKQIASGFILLRDYENPELYKLWILQFI